MPHPDDTELGRLALELLPYGAVEKVIGFGTGGALTINAAMSACDNSVTSTTTGSRGPPCR